MARVVMEQQAREDIFSDICQRPQIEACGILLGKQNQAGDWYITEARALRNTASSAVYFEFEPEELLMMELQYPEQIIGIYHSHPTGYACASETDINNMRRVNLEQQIPWAWLIVCGPFDSTFRMEGEQSMHIIAYHYYPDHGLCTLKIQSSIQTEPSTHSSQKAQQDYTEQQNKRIG
ncbi:Mov34/MPN/PAD-1 family protein [Tengunoibacter tsumagoiensis]|uniref:MPN domain-containing protein n=1 Tax=Tengunoibacter tsumagoiensis TaxID=2014871 RepID=A0A402A1W6_9CHLR|nr:Mov34/MPN/PAD-1 family protein [Tengunoibacter tsumagoiensis]GCE13052.1 hypothetical protein KTT_29110 [Tengunoibacter tsumagoiensis]